MIKFFVNLLVLGYVFGVGLSSSADYRLGMTGPTSILWGTFWGSRMVCHGTSWSCSILPWGVFPDAWVMNWRPEVKAEIETYKVNSQGYRL